MQELGGGRGHHQDETQTTSFTKSHVIWGLEKEKDQPQGWQGLSSRQRATLSCTL